MGLIVVSKIQPPSEFEDAASTGSTWSPGVHPVTGETIAETLALIRDMCPCGDSGCEDTFDRARRRRQNRSNGK